VPTEVPTPEPTAAPTPEPIVEPTAPPKGIPDLLLLAQDTAIVDGSYPVYYGPGELYNIVPNATLTSGTIKVYGKVDSWVMIAYSLPDGSSHVGYVNIAAIPPEVIVNDLTFAAVPMVLNNKTVFTDDPIVSNLPLIEYNQGQPVTVLATMGIWTYVEVENYMDSGLPARGFVDSSKLN
jgi:hypothetical protein